MGVLRRHSVTDFKNRASSRRLELNWPFIRIGRANLQTLTALTNYRATIWLDLPFHRHIQQISRSLEWTYWQVIQVLI